MTAIRIAGFQQQPVPAVPNLAVRRQRSPACCRPRVRFRSSSRRWISGPTMSPRPAPRWGEEPAMTEEFHVEEGVFDGEPPTSPAIPAGYADAWDAPVHPQDDSRSVSASPHAAADRQLRRSVYERAVPAVREAATCLPKSALDRLTAAANRCLRPSRAGAACCITSPINIAPGKDEIYEFRCRNGCSALFAPHFGRHRREGGVGKTSSPGPGSTFSTVRRSGDRGRSRTPMRAT